MQPEEPAREPESDPAAMLLDAARRVVPGWLRRVTVEAGHRGGVEPAEIERRVDDVVEHAAGELLERLGDLLGTDVDAQRSTPLTLLRESVREPTQLLRETGARPPWSPDADRFPDDVSRVVQPKIVVTGRIPEAGLDLLRAIDGSDVWAWTAEETVPSDVRDEQLADADAAVTLITDRVDTEFLDAAPQLQVVANVAVGYNNIDVAACAERGIIVTNTPGVLTDATADLAMGLVLMSTRRLGEGERLIRSGAPWQWGMFMMLGPGLQGRTLGIIGMGDIGTALATRAQAFGMRIVYHNRRRVDADVEARLEARLVDLDELLATSDIVSLNCPYNETTHHLIDAAALATMQPSAHLINTARGAIVDEAADAELLL